MKKSDLKSGMVVEMRSEGKYLVMLNPECPNRELISLRGGYLQLNDYRNDLTYCGNDNSWDIIKVYSLGSSVSNLFDKERRLNYNKIWERNEEPIEMTIAEIEAKLGIKNLKIIKEN